MKTVGIAVVGERDILREGLLATLRMSTFKVCRDFVDSAELVKTGGLLRTCSLFVVIESASGRDEAKRAIAAIRTAQPTTCVVVVADHRDDTGWAFDAGADGCLPCTISPKAFLIALELMACREVSVGAARRPPVHGSVAAPLDAARSSIVTPQPPSGILSPRELEVLDFVAKGESNKRIARHLSIGEATVKGHVRTVLRKIGAVNRTQAAVWVRAVPPYAMSPKMINGYASEAM